MKVPRSAHHDFRFISESTFLLENRECGEGFGLHLYSFDPNLVSTSGPSDQHSTVPSPKRIAIFQFPPLASSEIRLWMSMVGLNMRGAYASKDNGRIFEVCRTRGVLVIHLVANRDIEIQLRNYLIFIDPSIFQNFPAQLQSATDTTSTIVPWSAWGQKNTRWAVDAGLRPSLGPRCYGTRVLLPDRLLDFNCLDVARDLNHVAVTGRDQYSGNLVGRDSPTLHPAGSVFREDVVSELPYREVKHGFEGPIWNICPGEDWVHR